MSADVNFYTLLDPMPFRETMDFLIHNQTEIVLKIRNEHFKSKIIVKKDSNVFSIYKFNFTAYKAEKVVCSFEISAEKYFFMSEITSTNAEFLLQVPLEIFKLQRRNNFRVSVPASVPYTCEISLIEGRAAKMKVEIRDLSLSGCQLVAKIDHDLVKDGDEVVLSLKLHTFDWEKIQCQAVRSVSTNLESKRNLGLKFSESSAAFSTDMQRLLVQLDRIHRGKTYE